MLLDKEERASWTDTSLLESEASARFWADHLGQFASEQRRKACSLALVAAGLSALSGLAVWATLSALDEWWAVAIVSVVAFTASLVGFLSTQRDYATSAGVAAALPGKYMDSATALRSAREARRAADPDAAGLASAAQAQFNVVKSLKDKLDPFPEKLQKQREAEWEDLKNKVKLDGVPTTHRRKTESVLPTVVSSAAE